MQIVFQQEAGFTKPLQKWREEHTETLKGPIDVFWLQRLIYTGVLFSIILDDTLIGYCICTKNGELSEFFLAHPFINESSRILSSFIEQMKVSCSVVSTRNPYLLSLCMDFAKSAMPVAYLFLDQDRGILPQKKHLFRLAVLEDRLWIENETEYARTFQTDMANRLLYILSDSIHQLGYGTISPNPLQPQYADIGGWVNPLYRNKGLGREIILHLKQICYERSLIPTCGCDLENKPSKRMLEQAGFYATDRMIKILF